MFCGTRKRLASGRVPRLRVPGARPRVLGPAGTDLQGVYPLEGGVLHRQEDRAVLQERPAAQEEHGTVEGPLQGH